MYLYVLSEINGSGYKPEWTLFIGFIATILAIFTIVSKNPVHSVLYLIGLFIFIALYLIVFGMSFMGVSYLLVYVGAISILFLFILMLINIRISELLTEGRNSAILAVIVILAFGFAFQNKLPYSMDIYQDMFNFINKQESMVPKNVNVMVGLDNIEINNAPTILGKEWDSSLIEITHISTIGSVLYNVLFMHIMIIGVILLLAMVGAIVITIKPEDRQQEANENNSPNYMSISPL